MFPEDELVSWVMILLMGWNSIITERILWGMNHWPLTHTVLQYSVVKTVFICDDTLDLNVTIFFGLNWMVKCLFLTSKIRRIFCAKHINKISLWARLNLVMFCSILEGTSSPSNTVVNWVVVFSIVDFNSTKSHITVKTSYYLLYYFLCRLIDLKIRCKAKK